MDDWGIFFLEKLDKVSYFYSLFFSFLLVCAWMVIFVSYPLCFITFYVYDSQRIKSPLREIMPFACFHRC